MAAGLDIMTSVQDLAGLNIVLIDDELSIIEINKIFLEHCGSQVSAFCSAKAGVDYIKQHHSSVDVVISDYQMPGEINGVDIYNLLLKDYPHIACIILTGFSGFDQKGVDSAHILEKPIKYEVFVSKIVSVVKAKKASGQ